MRNVSMFILLSVVCTIYSLPTLPCTEEQFSCGDGNCVPIEWVCDNIKDCAHGKDESSCNYLHICQDGDFMCRNGECVDAKFKCNGESDCTDGSDEAMCRAKVSSTSEPEGIPDSSLPVRSLSTPTNQFIKRNMCQDWEFKCEKSDKCIDRSKICDDKADCEYMEDEKDCGERCSKGQQRCVDDSGCYIKCDGYADCRDGSDEEDCNLDNLPTFDAFFNDPLHTCKREEFQCSDGTCILKAKLCDGEKDCDDGGDEGGLCNACAFYECSYKCHDSPKGPECYCPEDSNLMGDFKTCEVANLCFDDKANRCNQLCKPTSNSISCYCAEGYKAVDANDCEVADAHRNGEIFFIHSSSLRRSSIFNISSDYHYEVVCAIPTSTKHVPSISLNPDTNAVYFVGKEDNHVSYVYEVQKFEHTPEKLFSAVDLKNIAVDWITGNIYYTTEGPYPGIGVCTPNGLYCKHLIYGEYDGQNQYTQRYGGIIVHPKRGIIIWLNYDSKHPEGIVYLAGMDGSNSRVLSSQISKATINTIAMDYVRDYLFVGEEHVMVRYDLHTLKAKTVEHPIHGKAMLFFNGHFYFIGRDDAKLQKAKFGETQHEFIRFLANDDVALAINNTIYYPNVHNSCDTMNCAYICVLTEKNTAKCICPDQYELDENTGKCNLLEKHSSRVKLSADKMMALCTKNEICQNGGTCSNQYNDTQIFSPTCSCSEYFTGLYCEIPLARFVEAPAPEKSSGLTTFIWMLFIILLLCVAIYFIHTRYPYLTDRLQHSIAFSHRWRRMNAYFGRRVCREQDPLTRMECNHKRPTRTQSLSDLSAMDSQINPVFGSSPDTRSTSIQEPSSLRKSPSSACKLNLEG